MSNDITPQEAQDLLVATQVGFRFKRKETARWLLENTKTGELIQNVSLNLIKNGSPKFTQVDLAVIGAVMPTLWKLGFLP